MNDLNDGHKQETMYLEKTLNVINKEMHKEEEALKDKHIKVIASRKEMWQESTHFSDDFDRIPEMNHYLKEVDRETNDYISREKSIEKYKKMLKSPYFGRFDFIEEGSDDKEKIYIGIYNLMDKENSEIYVYDWRAPISGIFYRSEIGRGSYKSPIGIISGDILLKRQYKIQDSRLKYYFDSSIVINDEILQDVLSKNASSGMRNIVETIQKEQDIVIRDTENELLLVQGAAGSGKTSIALHRIAYLFYEGLNSKISANNVIIISPNAIFSRYISSVLPELGEKNVEQITFEDIAFRLVEKRFSVGSRQEQLESLVSLQGTPEYYTCIEQVEFKGSEDFVRILDRLIEYCERVYIDFKDIYYNGKLIETRQQLRNFFLNNKIDMPISKRLKRIENMILDKVHPLRKERLARIEKIVEKNNNHMLEVKAFSRLIAVKEARIFMNNLHSFTEIDYFNLYKLLFSNRKLFIKLSEGIELPENIAEILDKTEKALDENYVVYEDCAPLLYLKMKIEGNDKFGEIKQVVIDEAQDYYPLQYEVFKLLFANARYTVLGDFNQSLERKGDKYIYDSIQKILDKLKSTKISLKKSYRSSFEINAFSNKLLNSDCYAEAFERHGEKPMVIYKENEQLIDKEIVSEINGLYNEGYESVAIICRTMKEAYKIHEKLKSLINVEILNNANMEFNGHPLVIPSYLAKGLEFDVVIVYNVSENNYKSEFDRRLLYAACTRALHKLLLYYTGNKSEFIKQL